MPEGEEWPRWGKKSWPRRGGKPLSHLATINLAEAAAHDVGGLLPREGMLRFWYVQDQSTWGFDPKDAGSFRVEYFTETAGLKVPKPPPDVEVFEACAVEFGAGMTLPGWEWVREYAPEREAIAKMDEYDALKEAIKNDSGHRMLGHAATVQGPMEMECQLMTERLSIEDEPTDDDERRSDEELGALAWRPLLQLDTDEDGPGWMWGDCGMVYYWMTLESLRAKRFERTWMMLQCC